MREIFGNRFDVRVIIDGKEYYPKEVSLQSSEGTSFTWKQRHWNTGTEGMAGAFDVVHRLPQGLKKPEERPKCSHCGYIDKDAYHNRVRMTNAIGQVTEYCETWIYKHGSGWRLGNRVAWT